MSILPPTTRASIDSTWVYSGVVLGDTFYNDISWQEEEEEEEEEKDDHDDDEYQEDVNSIIVSTLYV